MKVKYFGQSLIIDLSEINSPAKQTYLAYISCPASEVRTCKLHCRIRETPRLASCIAVYASEFGGIKSVETIPQNTLECARVTEATDVSESPNSGVNTRVSCMPCMCMTLCTD